MALQIDPYVIFIRLSVPGRSIVRAPRRCWCGGWRRGAVPQRCASSAGTALTLRKPLDSAMLPAHACAGDERLEGVDYRGVPVVSEMRPVAARAGSL